MSRKALRALALCLPFHLTAVAVTWRDIGRRPPERVRGSKRLWRSASAVNTLGDYTVSTWVKINTALQ